MGMLLLIVTVGVAVAGVVKDKDKEMSAVEASISSMANEDTVQTLPLKLDSPPNNPQLLVNNPSTGLSVQTLPSPVQFAKAGLKQPYTPDQNKQQYTKPFPADSDNSPALTKTEYNPNLLVNNPSSGISAQTLPSPIQFEQEYTPGQNKQQYTKPFPADSDNTPAFTKTVYNPQLLVSNPSSVNSVQTLPSPIQFAQEYIPGQNKQQYLRGSQFPEEHQQKFVLLNPVRQTRPVPAPEQVPVENIVLARSVPADFLPGVSTRPSYPPGYTPYTVARNTPESPDYTGPKTLLYIF